MVTRKEVNVCPEAAIYVAKSLGCRYILGDLRWRIPVLDRVQNPVRPLLAAAASSFAEDMPHKRLLCETVRMWSRVIASRPLLRIEVDTSARVEPYSTIL